MDIREERENANYIDVTRPEEAEMVLSTIHPAESPVDPVAPKAPSLTLGAGETLTYGIPRITLAQLDWMLDQLRHEPDRDEAVHQARKAAKRVRGVLRLMRAELGYFRYREENVVLRDVSRRLSPVRSSAVTIETVEALAASERDPLPTASRLQLRLMLQSRHTQMATSVLDHPQLLTDVVVTLLTARSRYRSWPTNPALPHPRHPEIRAFRDTYDAIAPGLERTYSRGRTAMGQAGTERTTRSMHLWRKRVKYLWYQLQVIREARPEVLAPLVSDLDDLGDLLGLEHDFAELGELIAAEPSYLPDPRQRFQYLTAIVAHRMELQARALRHGTRLYDETPHAFVARIGEHWKASRR